MKPKNLFVIQPFTVKHSKKLWEIIEEICKNFKGEIEPYRADKKKSEAGPRLQDRIDSYIKKADICIADITGTRNENVLLEVGAALTLKIPVILIANSKLPSDLSGNLYIDLDIDNFDSEKTLKTLKKDLKSRLTEVLYKHDIPKGSQFIVYGYKNRRVVDFYSIIKRCQKSICILTTNLDFFVTEKLDCGFGPTKMTMLRMVAQELKNKPSDFYMKILTLDPDSNYTNDRASALSKDRQEFREHMRADLQTVKKFVESEDCKASVEVKIYDAFPLQMTYFFDDKAISSVVNNSHFSRECITYEHSLEENGSGETYSTHFDKLWSNAKSYARNPKHAPRKNTWK